MSAVRLARAATGRAKILKFEGCYHGHGDSFLIQAGSGAATFGEPSSPGITQGTAADTLNARYNDLASVDAAFAANPEAIASLSLMSTPLTAFLSSSPIAEPFAERRKFLPIRPNPLIATRIATMCLLSQPIVLFCCPVFAELPRLRANPGRAVVHFTLFSLRKRRELY